MFLFRWFRSTPAATPPVEPIKREREGGEELLPPNKSGKFEEENFDPLTQEEVLNLKIPSRLKKSLKILGIEWKDFNMEECKDGFYELHFLQMLTGDDVTYSNKKLHLKRIRLGHVDAPEHGSDIIQPNISVIAWNPRHFIYVDRNDLEKNVFDFEFEVYVWNFDTGTTETMDVLTFFEELE